MRGKRLRMKVLVDEDRLEDHDAIALINRAHKVPTGLLADILEIASRKSTASITLRSRWNTKQ